MSHSSPPITHHGLAIRYASSIASSPYRWSCQARNFRARGENCSAIDTILHLVQLLIRRAEHVVPAHRACPRLALAVGQVAAAVLVGRPTAVDTLTRVLRTDYGHAADLAPHSHPPRAANSRPRVSSSAAVSSTTTICSESWVRMMSNHLLSAPPGPCKANCKGSML